MSLYVNNAAIESWFELEKVIDPPLQEMMVRSGVSTDTLNAWVAEMLENSVDAFDDVDRSAEPQPKRMRRFG